MKTISRYIMTLALLLTAVTGAWAEETLLTTINASSDFISGSKTFDGVATVTFTGNIAYDDMPNYGWSAGYGTPGGSVSVEPAEGITISSCKFYFNNNETYTISTAPFVLYLTTEDSSFMIYTGPNSTGEMLYGSGIKKIEVYGAAEPPITVAWNASTKTGTFAMPGSDVVLTPIYAKAAAFATTGTEPEVKTLLPEAAEGVIAGTDAPLIKEGTGIVAFAGTSTEVKQGTLMYTVTPATETQAPPLDAANKWSAEVPTAKTVPDGGIDVLVWYYIKGADAPDGEAATLDNTFDDTEPACLTVTVLSNKFDITLNAANANTIEAGKATVTVGGTAATVTEGKLEGVKMGTEVKVKANTGYKFRKVEVKKKEAEALPALNITNPSVGQVIGSDGKNYVSGTLPTGVTAVAKICYVSGSNGLALALTDEEGQMDWSTAQTVCAAHTPAFTGGTWKLATKDEWNSMISAAGSDADLRDGFGFVGGTNMQSSTYWSSTESGSSKAWDYYFVDGGWFEAGWYEAGKDSGYRVRACLAF